MEFLLSVSFLESIGLDFLRATSERSKVGFLFLFFFPLNAVDVTFHVSAHPASTNKYINGWLHGFTVHFIFL